MPELPPNPQLLLNSLRNVGYTLKAAIADLIDNSITAQASHISVQYRGREYQGGPWIAICDNGIGMTSDELLNNMRLGCRTIEQPGRRRDDLGRFGLGMKMASFSQCRKLTVFSWKNNTPSAYCWDLDNIVSTWEIHELPPDEIENSSILATLKDDTIINFTKQGTVVLWEKIDRDCIASSTKFDSSMKQVKEHLSLVFHRFMVPEAGYQSTIGFDMNNVNITPKSPFGSSKNINRHILPSDQFESRGEIVTYRPYLLPRAVDCSPAEYKESAGTEGYLINQGFYVYRNRRLIERATWFRQFKKEFKTQLLRIQIDIPAELDEYWEIDVRKSQATPPSDIQERIISIVEQAMNEAKSVWDSERRNVTTKIRDIEPVWKTINIAPNIYEYEINTQHTLYQLIQKDLSAEKKKLLKEYMILISKAFPYDRYYADRNQNADIKIASKDTREFQENLADTLLEMGLSTEQIQHILEISQI